MVRVKGSKIICLILSVLIFCTFLQIPTGAAGNTVIGVSLTTSTADKVQTASVDRGGSFIVNVESPDWSDWPDITEADSIEIRVDYDPKVVQCDSISIENFSVPGKYSDYVVTKTDDTETYNTCFAVVLPNNGVDPQYDISGGLKIRANMHVLPTARVKQTYIDLSTHMVSIFTNYETGEKRELWENCTERTYVTQKRAIINIGGVPPRIDDKQSGLSVEPSQVYNGEEVTATVKVPLIAWDATDRTGTGRAFIDIQYDASRFTVDQSSYEPSTFDWHNNISGDTGYVGVTLRENAPELDEEFTLKVKLRAKDDAAAYNEEKDNFFLLQELYAENNPMWTAGKTSARVWVTGYPLSDGGISPSEQSVKRGNDFNVSVTIPAFSPEVAQKAESASFKVNYPASVFSKNGWTSNISDIDVNDDGNGKITVSAKGFDFSAAGNVITFDMHADENAVISTYDITLTEPNVTITGDSRSGWSPATENTVAKVSVYDDYNVQGAYIALTKPDTDAAADTINAGDKFDVVVYLPAVPATSISDLTFVLADVGYDYETFDLLDTATGHSGISVSATVRDGRNCLTFTKNTSSSLSLTEPLKLRAHLQSTPESTDTHWFTLDLTSPKIGNDRIWADANPPKVSITINGKTNFAATGGGLTAPEKVRQGEKDFKVCVNIPKLTLGADSIDIGVDYDSDVFTVTRWELTGIDTQNVVVDINSDPITLRKKSDTSRLTINGATLTLYVTASENATEGSHHDFILSPHSIMYKSKTAQNPDINLWGPAASECTKTVTIVSSKISYYSTDGSIIALPESVRAGRPVTVTVTIPAIGDVSASSASFNVQYDTSAFTLDTTSLISSSSAFTSTGSGFAFSLRSGQTVSLNSPITFTATFTSKTTASGLYTFSLYPGEFTSVGGTAGDIVWSPTSYSDTVNVTTGTTPTPGGDYPMTDGGINIKSTSVKRSGTFDLTVTIPRLNAYVSDIDVLVAFDNDNFTCKSVSTSDTKNTTAAKDNDLGYITLALKKGEAQITSAITLTAKMQAKSDAVLDWYDFNLVYSNIYGIPNGSVTPEYLWDPDSIVDSIEVTKSSGGGTTPTPSSDYPVRGGGISLSRLYAVPGDLVTVYVNVPAIAAYATGGAITIGYNTSVFDVVSWDSYFTGISTGYNSGYLTLSLNNYYGIDLTRGASFSATLKVRANATYGRYLFDLVSATLRDSDYNDLWIPATNTAYLTVSNGSYNGGYYYPWPNDPYPGNNGNNNNGGGNNNGGNNSGGGNNNGGNNNNNGGSNNTNNNNEQPLIDDLPDEMDIDPDDEDGMTIDPGRRPDIKLTSELSGVNNGRLRAKTFSSFFGGDTIIYIRNTEEADRSAETALRTLRLSDHNSYAFDISVYDTATGQYIHYLRNNGYIDLYVPVPASMSDETGDIAVYHVQDGVPEPIDSIVISDDGVRKVHFRANSFSPYMFVDLTNLKQPETVLQPAGNYTRPDNSSYPRPSGNDDVPLINGDTRPANPHTGLAGWLVIPAGAAACVFLAKRDKKRKRSKRR